VASGREGNPGLAFGGLVGCVLGLRRTLAVFLSGGSTRANPVPGVDKHGATPHAARDNPYVVLLLISPRIFDLYTILLQSMERASQSGLRTHLEV
jgi:hypothetical protein